MKLNSEIKLGVIVIISLVLGYWGLCYLKGRNIIKPINTYYVTYTHSDGLVQSAPVTLDGFQVGIVENIEYQFDNPGHILVTLTMNDNLKIPKDGEAVISQSLLGSPSIKLNFDHKSKNFIKPNSYIKAGYEESITDKLTGTMLKNVNDLIMHTDSLIVEIQDNLKGDQIKNTLNSLQATSDNLKLMSDNAKYLDKDIKNIVSNAKNITNNLSSVSNKLDNIKIDSISNNLNYSLENVNKITKKLGSNDNSLGLLMNDSTLYLNINKTIESANSLLIDINKKPKKYVHFSLF